MNIKVLLALFIFVSWSLGEGLMDSVARYKKDHNIDGRVTVFKIRDSISNDTLFLKGAVQDTAFFSVLEKWKENSEYHVVDSLITAPDTADLPFLYGVVWLSVVNLRSYPSVFADMVTQAIMGTPLKIYLKEDDYFLVQTPDQYLGWLEQRRVLPLTKEEYEKFYEQELGVYWEPTGWAYTEKDTRSRPARDLVIMALFRWIKEDGDWTEIEFFDGERAFVKTNEMRKYKDWKKQEEPDAEKIIKDAERFYGVPYFWSGTSGKMLDCSGLVQTVFKMNNILLPRDASQQVFKGKEVPMTKDLKHAVKGDLLFFGYYDSLNFKEKITHVGIYSGNREYIHESVYVHYNSFDSLSPIFNKNAYPSLRAIRRILPEE